MPVTQNPTAAAWTVTLVCAWTQAVCYPLGNTQVTCERLDSRLLGQVEETRVKEPAGGGTVTLLLCPQSAEMRGEVRRRGGNTTTANMPPARQVRWIDRQTAGKEKANKILLVLGQTVKLRHSQYHLTSGGGWGAGAWGEGRAGWEDWEAATER